MNLRQTCIRIFFIGLLAASVPLIPVQGFAQGLVGDIPRILDQAPLMSNLTSLLRPKAGNTYTDATFGTLIKRLSDARDTPDHANNGNLLLVANEYSTMTPFNIDNSRLLLIHFSYFALYDGQGNYLRDLPLGELPASAEPRWSRTDPNVFYYLNGNRLKRYDLNTDSATVVREFSEYQKISGLGESDISEDGAHLVLCGDSREIFLYDIASNTKSKVQSIVGTGGVDNLFVTPDNNVIVGWYNTGYSRYHGFELFDHDMNFLRQLTPAIAHADVMRDTNGEEILLWHNSPDPNPLHGCVNALVKVRLADASQHCLLAFDWGNGIHISGTASGGWVIVSTYSTQPTAPLRYQNEILRVRVDGSKVEELAKHGSRPYDNYSFMPKAASSSDGRLIVYASNYGLQAVLGYPTIYTDEFFIDTAAPGTGNTGVTDSGNGPGSGNSSGPGAQPCADYYQGLLPAGIIHQEESIPAAVYQGDWYSIDSPLFSGNSVRLAYSPGASVSYYFSGTAVSWIGYSGPFAGAADITIDNTHMNVVNGYAGAHKLQARMYTALCLQPGNHVLTVAVMQPPQQLPDDGHAWVVVDGFDTLSVTSPLSACVQC